MSRVKYFYLRRWLFIFVNLFILRFTLFGQDPNANPNWDWRSGDNPAYVYPGTEYKYYSGTIGSYIYIKAPWAQFNAPDLLNDNKKEDGWILIARDFGTSTRPIAFNSPAYFALYSRTKSLLRVFLLVNASANFTTGAIIMYFGSGKKTATLTHLYPRAYATDKQAAVQDNHASSFSNTVANGVWVWGDFPMAYDPTIVPVSDPDCPRLFFQVIGTTETSIHLSGTATGIGGSYKNVRDFLSGGSNGLGVVAASEAMPTSVGNEMNFSNFKSKVFGTSNDWASWKNSLNDLYKNLKKDPNKTDFLSKASNWLADKVGELKDNWVVDNLPVIGFGVGLVDFLLGGGNSSNKAQVSPTYFAFNLTLEGKAVTDYHLATGASIPVPASKSNPEVSCIGSSVPLLYNNPVGIFNLTKTPVLKVTWYTQGVVGGDTPGQWKPSQRYMDFQVKDELEYKINAAAGLVLDSIRAWIVMDPSGNVNMNAPTLDENLKLLSAWSMGFTKDYDGIGSVPASPVQMHLESSTDGRYAFASAPVDGNAFRFQRMVGPDGKYNPSTGVRTLGWTPDMTIKLKVVLHRADDPNAVPVLLVLTYEPDIDFTEYANGPKQWPAAPFPVVTPVANKWNMLGLPNQSYNYIQGSANYNASYVYANAVPPVYAFESGNYVAKDVLNTNAGYWVQFPSAQNVTYYGPGLFSKTIAVKAGWNLISSVSTPIATDKISSVPASIISSYFYEYNGGYQQTTMVKPGYGHWVKVSQDGQIVLDGSTSSTPLPPPSGTPPPPAPTLISPSNLAVNQSVSPMLIWNSASSASSYRLQVSTASDFSTVLVNDGNITGTSKQVGPLANSTTYYWRVNASNSSGTGPWSSVWRFLTQNSPNSDPCLLADITSVASMDQLTITDANGNQQSLYVRNRGRGVKNGLFDDVDMPPVPMAGIFDVRFQSGKFMESIPPTREQMKIPIAIRGAAYPLTVSWNIKSENATTYMLTMPTTQNDIRPERVQLKNSGSRRFNNAGDGVISLQASSNPCPGPVVDKMSGTPEESSNIPASFALKQNTPNPFNPSTTIEYDLPVESYVTLKVYDILGRESATLVDGVQNAGFKSLNFDADKLTSGVYFYRLQSGKFSAIKKMILMK